MKKLLTLIFLTALFTTAWSGLLAQVSPLETNHWYFGNQAGIRFNPPSALGRPVALDDAASDLDALEGTASISNLQGRLMFYVGTSSNPGQNDYASIFNRIHQHMPYGDSLIGGSSSSQNALVVRQPGNTPNYIIFHVAQLENYSAFGNAPRDVGFYYTVVDTTLDSGFGDVVRGKKNVLIVDSISEKVTACQHANGRDLWVLSHRYNNNEFVSVRVTATGVSQPVISPIGIRYGQGPDNVANFQFNRGCMKLSPNGNRFASAITEDYNGTHYVQLGRFDNRTGTVSEVIHIPFTGGTGFGVYGVEFSGDNSKLYVGDRQRDQIYQFDLCAGTGDSASIVRSKVTINAGFEPGSLQLGLDGRIYVSVVDNFLNDNDALGCITQPNLAGPACNYVERFVTLAPGTTCDRGLTNVNQSIFNSLYPNIEFTRLCERDTVQFSARADCQGVPAQFYFDFGDPASGSLNIDSNTTGDTRHFYAQPGNYRVKLRIVAGTLEDTTSALVEVTPLARGIPVFSKLACKQQYSYGFSQDIVNFRPVTITNYRWHVTGYPDTTLEGADKSFIELLWDSNQVAKFALYLETTTAVGEICVSDSITFDIKVNQQKGQTPIGPDTLCFDPNTPFVFTSPDTPRTEYQWVYSPASDRPELINQGTQTVSVIPTSAGPKSIKTAFFYDTVSMVCYTESALKKFYAAAAPADSIRIFGDSSICASEGLPQSRFEAYGRNATSTVHWRFTKTNPDLALATFKSDTLGDTVTVRFDNLSKGRNLYFLEGQEISKDGCLGPVSKKEIWNACIDFPTIVTSNNDGVNDVFKIDNGENFPDSEMSIFNRWGKRVYKGKAGDTPDMRNLNAGTYFYRIRVFWEGRNLERTGWFDVSK